MNRMVSAIVALLITGWLAGQVGKPVTFEWDNSNESADEVTEYVFYQAPAQTGPWTAVASIPVAQGRVVTRELTVDTGRHYFYVTAKNRFAESGPSNIVSILTDKPRAVIIRIK